jgi:hypothetical protein
VPHFKESCPWCASPRPLVAVAATKKPLSTRLIRYKLQLIGIAVGASLGISLPAKDPLAGSTLGGFVGLAIGALAARILPSFQDRLQEMTLGMKRLGLFLGVVVALSWLTYVGVASRGFTSIRPAGWLIVFTGVPVSFGAMFLFVWGIDWVITGFRNH